MRIHITSDNKNMWEINFLRIHKIFFKILHPQVVHPKFSGNIKYSFYLGCGINIILYKRCKWYDQVHNLWRKFNVFGVLKDLLLASNIVLIVVMDRHEHSLSFRLRDRSIWYDFCWTVILKRPNKQQWESEASTSEQKPNNTNCMRPNKWGLLSQNGWWGGHGWSTVRLAWNAHACTCVFSIKVISKLGSC